jgi:AbrB family looped-hinge helix DNA binding protein
MAKVTSKLQVTIPKRLADEYGITPGDEIDFVSGEDGIRVVTGNPSNPISTEERLKLFDAATARQRARQRGRAVDPTASQKKRGWTREELYTRGRTD